MNVDFHVTKYQQIVEDLRSEVTELKEKLAKYEDQPPGDATVMSISQPLVDELNK